MDFTISQDKDSEQKKKDIITKCRIISYGRNIDYYDLVFNSHLSTEARDILYEIAMFAAEGVLTYERNHDLT